MNKDIPYDLKNLYIAFGRSAEMAQLLEVEAGNVALALLAMSVDTDSVTDQERQNYREFVDDLNQQTL